MSSKQVLAFALATSLGAVRCSQPPTPPVDAMPVDSAADAGRDAREDDSAPDAGEQDTGADAGVDAAPFVVYPGVDDRCPGAAHCPMGSDGMLYVGVARALINPTIVESMWTDTNMNNLWESGETYVDTNGNGRFDATWIAGFSSGRPATSIHDDLEVRAMAFRSGDVTVAIVSLDIVGLFRDDMERIRQHPSLAGLDVDHVLISSTHLHEGVDTVGLWGESPFMTGVNATYQSLVIERAANAVRDAVRDAMRPEARALMRVAQVLTVDGMMDPRPYVSDTRDPTILDPTLTMVQFVRERDPMQTIGTWVNWAAHPEYTGSRNNQLTADYVHTLRDVIENGDMMSGVAGIGGTTVFVNGALGGQVGPGQAAPLDRMGMPVRNAGLLKAESCGRNVAVLGLQELRRVQGTANNGLVTGPMPITYRTAKMHARVLNRLYWLGFQFRVLSRQLTNFNRSVAPSMTNVPWVESRATYLQVGPVATITAPGELHPELWVGAQDMRWSFNLPRVTERDNPPDFMRAPPPPYLRDLMLANSGVRYAFVSGLTQDFLGYIVADWNYVLHPTNPYTQEASGDHYEETNSIGPDSQEHLFAPMMDLARMGAVLDGGAGDAGADASADASADGGG
ncbi:MAG: hypothetical protein JNK05_19230 [Myxococcales bacterium]|nr:hypothetical protein [Myxococcales bacterium]